MNKINSANHTNGVSNFEHIIQLVENARNTVQRKVNEELINLYYNVGEFYETYKDDQKVSTVLTQLGWTNHLLIMARTKTQEERQYYINLCIHEHYSKRELDRQITAMRYGTDGISGSRGAR